ncbi:Uncharacterised protein [Shigella sonnei]|nr:Uncharacterised protein [Shigella sonnei]
MTLSSGNRPALNSSPSSPAIAAAARGLSPVRITPLTPSAFSSLMAVAASARRVSCNAMIPSTSSLRTTSTTVCPALSSSLIKPANASAGCFPAAQINTRSPLTCASMPDPTSARCDSAVGMASSATCASRTMACASGCVAPCSTAAASVSSSDSLIPVAG